MARQLVNERLLEARQPHSVRSRADPLGPVATAFSEIYQYSSRATRSTRWNANDPRLGSAHVAVGARRQRINSWGGLTKQFQIVVDPRQLDRYGLSLRQV